MSRKVSVVVPTYRSGPGLDRLVASVDAQTMPAADIEMIFVDDGSPDDTYARLEVIRDAHRNVRLARIENSGWPSRPRNVGLEMAEGEYVLFMDHDDLIYPDALRAGYALAARNGADVVNGKETRTDQPSWATDTYQRNIDNAVDRTDLHPLIPTNPHKLFRRQLLMEHDIRFPEGGRVLWEDVFFNLDVAQHAEVISVLADTPFYHWVREGVTTSSSYRRDRAEYWRWVREIVLQTNEKLAAPRLSVQHRLMLVHQYRSRILARLGGELTAAPEDEQRMVHDVVAELLDKHIPETFDQYLTPTQLGRAVLARAGRWDLVARVSRYDAGLAGRGTATDVHWDDGRLLITAVTRWTASKDTPLAVRRDGERIVRDLPDDLAAALPDAALDMTAAIRAARTDIGVRSRNDRVTWMLPGETETTVEDVDGRPALRLTVRTALDPQDAFFGRRLDATVYDAHLRAELTGGVTMRGLVTSTPPRSALRAGHVYVAYRNDKGALSIDVDQTKRSLSGSAPLDPGRARFERADGGGAPRWRVGRKRDSWRVAVPFTDVATSDDTVLRGSVKTGRLLKTPATIVARDGDAWLETTVSERPGTYGLKLIFQGREMDSGLDLVVGAGGQPRLRRRSA